MRRLAVATAVVLPGSVILLEEPLTRADDPLGDAFARTSSPSFAAAPKGGSTRPGVPDPGSRARAVRRGDRLGRGLDRRSWRGEGVTGRYHPAQGGKKGRQAAGSRTARRPEPGPVAKGGSTTFPLLFRRSMPQRLFTRLRSAPRAGARSRSTPLPTRCGWRSVLGPHVPMSRRTVASALRPEVMRGPVSGSSCPSRSNSSDRGHTCWWPESRQARCDPASTMSAPTLWSRIPTSAGASVIASKIGRVRIVGNDPDHSEPDEPPPLTGTAPSRGEPRPSGRWGRRSELSQTLRPRSSHQRNPRSYSTSPSACSYSSPHRVAMRSSSAVSTPVMALDGRRDHPLASFRPRSSISADGPRVKRGLGQELREVDAELRGEHSHRPCRVLDEVLEAHD